jgi:vancomycin resistance protein YoaR
MADQQRRLARAEEDAAQDASFAPPIPVATGPEVSLEELRRQNLKRLENDKSTLEEEYEQLVRSPRGRGRDPRLEETREGYLKAVEEAERVLSDDKSTEADVMAALIAKNSARLAYQAARNPNPSDPGPFVAGASTFLEEAGSRALSLMSLGGFAAVNRTDLP